MMAWLVFGGRDPTAAGFHKTSMPPTVLYQEVSCVLNFVELGPLIVLSMH